MHWGSFFQAKRTHNTIFLLIIKAKQLNEDNARNKCTDGNPGTYFHLKIGAARAYKWNDENQEEGRRNEHDNDKDLICMNMI